MMAAAVGALFCATSAAAQEAPTTPPAPVAAAPAAPPAPPPLTAGWDGNHLFIKSPDGQFHLSPAGYFIPQHTIYAGDGAPANGFRLKYARFGVVGGYGKSVDYGILADFAGTTGSVLRDVYVRVNVAPWLRLQAGQFKEPFSAEALIGDPNVELWDRSIVQMLYPSATNSFRSPGAMAFGAAGDGMLEYWAGAFNGRGLSNPASSNWPELVSRLRAWPLRWTKSPAVERIGVGGSLAYSRTAAIAQEQSFSGAINDGAYTFFPSFPVNGPVRRYNVDLVWLWNSLGLRAEYSELQQARDDVGASSTTGGGFQSLPTVVGRGFYVQGSYWLTGERAEENAAPRVRHPLVGPASADADEGSGYGAFQVVARAAWVDAKAPGRTFDTFTPTSVPGYTADTYQLTFGVNWYLNQWAAYKLNLDVDRLNQPSVQGILPQTYFAVIQQLQVQL